MRPRGNPRHRLRVALCPDGTLRWVRRFLHCCIRSLETGMSSKRLKTSNAIRAPHGGRGSTLSALIALLVVSEQEGRGAR